MVSDKDLNCNECARDQHAMPPCDFVKRDDDGNPYCENWCQAGLYQKKFEVILCPFCGEMLEK